MFALCIIPTDFNILLITTIPKIKITGADPNNFRPISVSSTYALLLELILDNRMNLKLHDNQFGFKKRTSTKHAYFVLNETIIYYKNGGSHCNVVSLDAAKAFDRLWRNGLFSN